MLVAEPAAALVAELAREDADEVADEAREVADEAMELPLEDVEEIAGVTAAAAVLLEPPASAQISLVMDEVSV